jgi:hypothetical protein
MSRHYKVKEAVRACSIALSLALPVSAAMAFSPEPSTPAQPSRQPTPLSPFGQQLSLPEQPGQATPAAPFSLTGTAGGTELTIPGIGSVGKLPELKFGVELLYNQKNIQDTPPLDQSRPDGDTQIKGTVRLPLNGTRP